MIRQSAFGFAQASLSWPSEICLQFSPAILDGPMTKLYCKKLEPLNNMFVTWNEPTSKP